MEIVLNVLIGLGLSATCGFRVFVPLLALSIAGLSGYLQLQPSFDWIATYPALIAFSVATVLEILGYFFPYVDNLLTTISSPVAVLAGVVVSAAVIGDMSPMLKWSLAIIAGGGVATATTLISNGVHHGSTLLSGGVANPVLSGIESAGAVVMSVLAVLVPILGLIFLVIGVFLLYKVFTKIKTKLKRPKPDYQVS